jgi:hypothetical protein
MPQTELDHIWLIAYINRDYVDRVEKDLLKHGLGSIRVYIPTVRILKKQFKNKNLYEYTPLLFNYGFFQLPYNKACDIEFLKEMREKIPAIYSWVSDPITLITTKPNLRADNREKKESEEEEIDGVKVLKKPERIPQAAIAREEEITSLLKAAENMSVFSDGIISQLQEGSFITLQGYPYEGIPAEIVDINKSRKEVKVRLLLETMITTATVSFENIFYTVYSDFDKSHREESLDKIDAMGKRNLDKIYAKINYE